MACPSLVLCIVVAVLGVAHAQNWASTSLRSARVLGTPLTSAAAPTFADSNGQLNKTAILPNITVTTCLGDVMKATCPGNYLIKVKGGWFGRENNAATCRADGTPQSLSRGNLCKSFYARSLSIDMCDGLSECTFTVNQKLFGRPVCTEATESYFQMNYNCELPVYSLTACEGETFLPSCMAGLEMQVVASYGRGDSTTCRVQDKDSYKRCAAQGALEKVGDLCNGRDWCAVSPGDGFFGVIDTCPDTAKYMRAEFTCAKCDNAYWSSALCEQWAEAGDCDGDNMPWMYAMCRKACTKCSVRGQCLNVANETDCYDWAFQGECDSNKDYMHAWCPKACNVCPEGGNVYVRPEPQRMVYKAPVKVADGFERVRACAEKDTTMTCPTGQSIYIKDVFFGRREGAVCMSGYGDAIKCSNATEDALNLKTAQKTCNGRQSCSLNADTRPFANPCPGAPTNRYLEVDFECRACESAQPSADCEFWARQGQCSKNFLWMPDQCYKECSQCATVETCAENKQASLDCDFWASYGECDNNRDWMKENCAKSCRLCDQAESE